MTGKVYLIGAGPGDPELLTLKAVDALGRCDVILLDDLVDRAVLAHCGRARRVIAVGKRGPHPVAQARIDALMIDWARRGSIVGRVKGGDPFVFGRGAEEARALRDAGIAVEVIPGLTAGLAVPATLGMAVTHRGLARGVTLVTGHTCDGGDVDWRALARTKTTIVIYMGVARIERITASLRAGGLAPSTPAAAIESGTSARQRIVVSTLGELARVTRAKRFASPSIFVIGDVVAAADPVMREAIAETELRRVDHATIAAANT